MRLGHTAVFCLSFLSALSACLARQYDYGTRYNYRTRESEEVPKCTRKLPCYDVTINVVGDGECNFFGGAKPNPEGFLEHYGRAGLGREDIMAMGREATEFFKQQTGYDFTALPKEAYLYGTATMNNGTVRFTPNLVPKECNNRVTTVQKGEEVRLVNQPMSEADWQILFMEETRVGGNLNRVLPAGSGLLFGTYLFDECGDNDNNCRPLLLPNNKNKPIIMKISSRKFFTLYQPGPFAIGNCNMEHPVLGRGILRGTAFPADDDMKRLDVSMAMRFPWPL